MTCATCGDKGIVRVRYEGGDPDEFALCLCAAGMAWRCDENAGRKTYPLWHVWAYQNQVAHDRIHPIEAWPDVPAALLQQQATGQAAALDDVLRAAGRSRRGKL
jgi:hypothetical protein